MKQYIPKKCKNPDCENKAYSSTIPYCCYACKNKMTTPNLKLKSLYKPSPKCIICKIRFTPKSSSLEKTCQEIDCKVKWATSVVLKQKLANDKKIKDNWNKEKLAIKDKLKTLSDWKKDLQTEINSIVREIDKGHACIATNTTNGKMNAGHYIGVGANSTLRFHLENIWLQSEHSNSWRSGDTIRYQQGIVSLYGKEYLEYMNSLQQINPLQLTIQDVKNKIPIARSILKWLKLQDRKFTLQERIDFRVKFNKEIGIY